VFDSMPQVSGPVGATPQNEARREWLASLKLDFASRRQRTALIENTHVGPLSVQRPFYPELAQPHRCHVYMLHPPGGLVAGDCIDINLRLQQHSQTLLTTPSAGKIYRTDTASHLQQQRVCADIEAQACLEWLPQETIVFSGANARIHNRFQLCDDAKLIAWDIVCLGRRASGETFDHGRCEQLIEVLRNQQLVLRERNIWPGESELMHAPWGMAGNTVAGTMFATTTVERRHLDQWRELLAQEATEETAGEWGITQKPSIFIARYLGQSAQQCRRGFELLWQHLRPFMIEAEACRPRIWNT